MNLLMFSTRDDELPFLEGLNAQYQFNLKTTAEPLVAANCHLCKGYSAISIAATHPINRALLADLKQLGVMHIIIKAAGYNHVDLDAAKEFHIQVSNVPHYSPKSIAEHTVMLILALLRNVKPTLHRINQQDFSIHNLIGRELSACTVGVVGTGYIGYETIKMIKGFGCEILAYDLYPSSKIETYASYVPLSQLLATSDIITFHCPLTKDNHHLICKDTIAQMKDNVYLINAARGGLFDYQDVLYSLKAGKIAGIGIDVYEKEELYIRKNLAHEEIPDPILKELLTMDNVLFTPHIGFYTKEAVSNIMHIVLENANCIYLQQPCKNALIQFETS